MLSYEIGIIILRGWYIDYYTPSPPIMDYLLKDIFTYCALGDNNGKFYYTFPYVYFWPKERNLNFNFCFLSEQDSVVIFSVKNIIQNIWKRR